MSKYSEAEEIMDNYKIGLVFPYHINHDLKVGHHYYNENYTEFHVHDFYSIVLRVSEEPKAFYLTEEDKEYYSRQELDIIEKIKQ